MFRVKDTTVYNKYRKIKTFDTVEDAENFKNAVSIMSNMKQENDEFTESKFYTSINEFKQYLIKENKILNIHTDDISDENDIKNFFTTLYTNYKLAFHPDDSFDQYIDENGNNIFTTEETEHLDEIMDKCFFIAKANHLDIYQIALDIHPHNR